MSSRSLKEKMSEVISLRERVTQAELQAGRAPTFLKERALAELAFDTPKTRENA
jgi:hypothetical protein